MGNNWFTLEFDPKWWGSVGSVSLVHLYPSNVLSTARKLVLCVLRGPRDPQSYTGPLEVTGAQLLTEGFSRDQSDFSAPGLAHPLTLLTVTEWPSVGLEGGRTKVSSITRPSPRLNSALLPRWCPY